MAGFLSSTGHLPQVVPFQQGFVGEESLRRAFRGDASGVQHNHPVAQVAGEVEVVGCDDLRAAEALQEPRNLPAPPGIEVARGSSSTRIAASMASTVAMAARLRWPMLRWKGDFPPTSGAPTARRLASTRRSTSGSGKPRLRGPKATSSRTVGQKSWSSGFWNTSPTRWRNPAQVAVGDGLAEDPHVAVAAMNAVQVQQEGRFARAVRSQERHAPTLFDPKAEPVERAGAVGVGEGEVVDLDRGRRHGNPARTRIAAATAAATKA
jgi:hypothetical protein